MNQVRAAIQARAKDLNLEKSEEDAEFFAARNRARLESGDPDSFAGLDLSQINSEKTGSSQWDETMPSMLYDPEDDMTKEQQERADPLMTKSFIEQATTEIKGSEWPSFFKALRDVTLVFLLGGLTAAIVINWDTFLRNLYTGLGFIPSPEDMASYASRFDGLDLPDGWMDNMNEADVAAMSDKLNGL